MPPADIRRVNRGEILEEDDVAHEPRARVRALEEIVAQDSVLRKPPDYRLLQGIDVVNSLPDERAFFEQVLVDIGNRVRVRIDPRFAGKELSETRPAGTG